VNSYKASSNAEAWRESSSSTSRPRCQPLRMPSDPPNRQIKSHPNATESSTTTHVCRAFLFIFPSWQNLFPSLSMQPFESCCLQRSHRLSAPSVCGHWFIPSFVTEGLRFARFSRARRCVGFQIAKYKLDSGKNHLRHLRSAKQQHGVT
jgi:hypothetical protein